MSGGIRPEVLVESSGLFPPLSGVGYYSLGLLEAYGRLPGRFPVRVLAPRFVLRSGPGPQEAYLARLAERFGGALEVRRRAVPGLVQSGLRRFGLRMPLPLDLPRNPAGRVYFFPNYVGEPLWRAPSVPVVYDLTFLRFPRSLRGRDDLFLKRYLPRTLRRASRVVVISDFVGRELRRAYGLEEGRVTTVYPAVDHSRFRPSLPPAVRRAARRRHGLEGGYIFSLGTLEPRKNFARLIAAYGRLPHSVRKRTPLVVAGGPGWKNRDIREAIRNLGPDSPVRLLGYIADEDRAPLLAEATLFVLPSLYEGFGLPVLEAMACGTPVVTSARGALPELGGRAVVYADPLDPDDVARAMLSVLKDSGLRSRLSAAGPRRAAAFSWERSAWVLAGVFRKAAAGAGN
jgi:glycosyltransferase involved in cell wall biosynthesis